MNAYSLPEDHEIDEVFHAFPQLETERLHLRALGMEDAPALLSIFSDRKVTQHYDLYPYTTLAEAEALIEFFTESFEVERSIRWGLERKADRILIGTCGFVTLRRFRGEIGYELGSAYWRKGYMREALTAILDFGFTELDLNRIEALVMLENRASAGLLHSLDFAEEGVLRQYDFFKGAFHDMRLLALLRQDWQGNIDEPNTNSCAKSESDAHAT